MAMRGSWFSAAIAVSAAGLAAQDDPAEFEQQVEQALDRARPALERLLVRTRGDALALVCLAAVHDGMGPDDTALVEGVRRLAKLDTTNTYALALRLMVAADYAEFPDRENASRRDFERLLEHQVDLGGFSYHPNDGWWDLSNTQYAALGLRAARTLGHKTPRTAWRLLSMAVSDAQKDHGGFTYRPSQGRGQADSSMTVAGIAVLEICRQEIDLDEATDEEFAAAIARAWQWIDEHGRDVGNAAIKHCLYVHYGLERAAILSGRETVAKVDWYRRGAEMILKFQKKNGDFLNRMDSYGRTGRQKAEISTPFAVLFLRRRFQRILDGPTTPGPSYVCSTLPQAASDVQMRAAIKVDVARGDEAVPDLLAAMRSPRYVRRKAAALALMRISGRDFRFHPARDAKANADALRRAERWWLGHRSR